LREDDRRREKKIDRRGGREGAKVVRPVTGEQELQHASSFKNQKRDSLTTLLPSSQE